MATVYLVGDASRRTAVSLGIIGLHVLFYLAIAYGMTGPIPEVIAKVKTTITPERPKQPPPEQPNRPSAKPIEWNRPVVHEPLIPGLSSGTSNGITVVYGRPQTPVVPVDPPRPRPVHVTAPRPDYDSRRLASALNACYPAAARRQDQEGRVVALVTVSAAGRTANMSVAQSSGFELLDGAAACVVGKLAFSPGTRDGQPVEAQVMLPITFKLE